MKKEMSIVTNISSKLRFVIGLHNVPLELWKKKENSYTLLYKDKENTCLITLMGAAYENLNKIKSNEKTKKSLNLNPLFIMKNDNDTINLFFHISLHHIPEIKGKSQRILIERLHEGLFSLHSELIILPKVLKNKIRTIKKEDEKENLRKDEARFQQIIREYEKKKKSEEVLNLVEKVNKLEGLSKNTVQIEKTLSYKGIYLVNPSYFKRCANCVNFTGSSICSAHGLEISENHKCSRFYSYKTFYGGSFSPK